MSLSGFAGIGNIDTQSNSGVVGGDAYGEPGGKLSGLWLGGATAGVNRTTIGAASAKTYTVTCTIYGVAESASYVADGSDTTTTIAAGLAAAVASLPNFGSFVTVTDSTNTFDVTGPADGTSFTVTDSDGDISQSTITAAATGSSVVPGAFVIVDPSASLFPTPTFLPASSLTAGTATLTLTYASGTVYTAAITVDGATYVATTIGATDLATTVGALITAINAVMPAVTVVAATGGAGEVVLTAEVAGLAFSAVVDAHTGAGTIAVSATSGLPTDDVSGVFGGFVSWTLVEDPSLGDNTLEFGPGSTISVKARGNVYLNATVTNPGPLYVTVATGAVSSSSGAGKLPIPESLAQFMGPAPVGSSLAVARVSCSTFIPA